MKVSKKIKKWSRLGQVAYWLCAFFYAGFAHEWTTYESKFSGSIAETIYAILGLICAITFTEVIVRLIGYFAELLDK